jgi:soluble lytic murein transglycosylase-like protein
MRVQLAAMIAPDDTGTRDEGRGTSGQVAPVVQVASLVPRTSYLATPEPIQLVFEALPPIERPKPFERPMPQNFTPDFYVELIRDAALQHDVPAALVQAVVKVESDFNARAVSPKGARGLMQVMPATARRFGVADPDHLFYPAPNLNAGTAYLAWLLKRYEGNLDLALAAYNAGEGAVETYRGIPPYRETRNYVKKVRKALGRTAA